MGDQEIKRAATAGRPATVRDGQSRDELMRQIWEKYYARLKIFTSLLMGPGGAGPGQDHEDIVQEIMVKILEKIGRYDPRYSLNTWIYSIARNHCRDHLRKRAVRMRYLHVATVEELPSRAVGPEESAIRREDEGITASYLEGLPDGDRQIAYLRFAEEMSYDEIGRVMRAPAGTMKYRVHEIRKGLKDALEKGRTGRQAGKG